MIKRGSVNLVKKDDDQPKKDDKVRSINLHMIIVCDNRRFIALQQEPVKEEEVPNDDETDEEAELRKEEAKQKLKQEKETKKKEQLEQWRELESTLDKHTLVRGHVDDHDDGTYTASYTIPEDAFQEDTSYQLVVTLVDGGMTANSPFDLIVWKAAKDNPSCTGGQLTTSGLLTADQEEKEKEKTVSCCGNKQAVNEEKGKAKCPFECHVVEKESKGDHDEEDASNITSTTTSSSLLLTSSISNSMASTPSTATSSLPQQMLPGSNIAMAFPGQSLDNPFSLESFNIMFAAHEDRASPASKRPFHFVPHLSATFTAPLATMSHGPDDDNDHNEKKQDLAPAADSADDGGDGGDADAAGGDGSDGGDADAGGGDDDDADVLLYSGEENESQVDE